MSLTLKDTHVSAWESVSIGIDSGTAITAGINFGGFRLFSIVMPDAWTAANITFQMSPDGGSTWANLKDKDGNEINAVAGASDCIVLDHTLFASFQHLRLRSGTSNTPVNQAAVRTVRLILRGV